MPEPKKSEEKKRTVLCPYRGCDAEVDLSEGDNCPSCGGDVAWILEKLRREDALNIERERRAEAEKKAKPKTTKPGLVEY